ncbi:MULTISPECIES: zinc-ribbon domain-containing protein [Shewanella]|nr:MULTISPECIES: zinc ribbon domain-containing protein [Shewanella]EKT4488947.1 hypothetical protein [Shewanella algae]MBO2664567.1 hypothetical protein [Shewanella algae]MCD8558206.1 hypothetical protein [Shewanella xiamenensis]MCL1056324.1 hypothetical protein [Shewanella algae]MCS6121056.1 hypothetical protein [Shewanella baltica]
MALVKCKECGEQVSTKAKSCPKCGAKPPKKTSFLTWAVLAFIVITVYGAYQQESNMTPEQKAARAEKREVEKAEEAKRDAEKKAAQDEKYKEYAWIEKGKDAVLARLKDPKSAEFKDVYFFRGADNVPMTCGQVNSKNSFGGFVGFQHFVSGGSPDMTFLQNEVDDFASVWNKFCTK